MRCFLVYFFIYSGLISAKWKYINMIAVLQSWILLWRKGKLFQLVLDQVLFLCLQVLIDWINDVLVEERIIVKQLEEDLYDGQVLQKLLGESTQERATLRIGRAQNESFPKLQTVQWLNISGRWLFALKAASASPSEKGRKSRWFLDIFHGLTVGLDSWNTG